MKNKLKHFTTLLITLTILLTTASAVQPSPQMAMNASSTNIEQGPVENISILDRFSGELLAFAEGPDVVEPGETVRFDPQVTFTETIDSEGLIKVTEFYRCEDSSCENPEQDEFLEADRQNIPFSIVKQEGNTWKWNVDYTSSEQEGYYAGVAYIYNPSTESLVTTSQEHIFEVRSSDTSNSDDSSNVDLQLAASPFFEVDEQSNSVEGSITIGNYGQDAMQGSDIVEMQVRPGTQNPLSAVSVQGTCDPDRPNNVHKEYSLGSGDAETISLTADTGFEDGEQYTVYFLTRGSCGGERTDPIRYSYNAGTFTFDGGEQVDDPQDPEEPESPSVEQVSKPQLSYENGNVKTKVSFKNTGGGMSESHIVEMQVRPKGERPLAFSSTQQVCDTEYPNNVHKEFNLDGGESASTTLSTSVSEAGEYDVFLLTRDQCAPGNERVDPYPNSVKAGTVSVGGEFGGFVEVVEDNPLVSLLFVGGVLVVAVGIVVRYL